MLRRLRPAGVAIFVSLVLATSCSLAPPADSSLLIRGVHVVDVVAERTLRDVDILIVRDRIEAVGERLEAPNGARIVEGRGRFVVSGLHDAHVHLDTTDRLRLMLPALAGKLEVSMPDLVADMLPYVLHGVLSVTVLEGNADVLALREHALATRDWRVPRMVVSSPILDGPESSNPIHLQVTSDDDLAPLLEGFRDRGYDLLKVYTFLESTTYDAILQWGADHDLPVLGHLPVSVGFESAIDTRLTAVAHAEEVLRFWDQEDEDFAQRAATLMCERGVDLVATLVTYKEILCQIDDIDACLREKEWAAVPPLMRFYSMPPHNGYVEQFGSDPETSDRYASYFRRGLSFMKDLVRALEACGGRVVAGTDTGNPTNFPGQSLHQELVLLVEAGLTPYRALAAATVEAAALHGGQLEIRVPAPGAHADFLLLERDPIEDIRSVASISAIVRAGRYLDAETLEEARRNMVEAFAVREARDRVRLDEATRTEPAG